MDLSELSLRLRMLAVFRGLLSDPVVEELCTYLDSLENGFPQMMVSSYAELVCRLYEKGGGDLGLCLMGSAAGLPSRRPRRICASAWTWSWRRCRRRRI